MPTTYTVNCACCTGGDVSGTGCGCDPMPRRLFLVFTQNCTTGPCSGPTLTGHVDWNAAGCVNRPFTGCWVGSVTDGTNSFPVTIYCNGTHYVLCFGVPAPGAGCTATFVLCSGTTIDTVITTPANCNRPFLSTGSYSVGSCTGTLTISE